MKDFNGTDVRRGIAPERHQAATTNIVSVDGVFRSGKDGAVFLRMEHLDHSFDGPFNSMEQLVIANNFPPHVPLDVQALQFPFKKVDTLPWAENGGKSSLCALVTYLTADGGHSDWDNFEFFNMTGLHLVFGDDSMDKLCHIQLWTLGLGETVRFALHNSAATI